MSPRLSLLIECITIASIIADVGSPFAILALDCKEVKLKYNRLGVALDGMKSLVMR